MRQARLALEKIWYLSVFAIVTAYVLPKIRRSEYQLYASEYEIEATLVPETQRSDSHSRSTELLATINTTKNDYAQESVSRWVAKILRILCNINPDKAI